VKIYKFFEVDIKYIEISNCKIAHNMPLVDDDFGACARAWIGGGEKTREKILQIIHGITGGTIIASMFSTRTLVHVEDNILSTFNLLILDAPKIWYIIPSRNNDRFRRFLKKKGFLTTTMEKRCFIQTFANYGYIIFEKEMKT